MDHYEQMTDTEIMHAAGQLYTQIEGMWAWLIDQSVEHLARPEHRDGDPTGAILCMAANMEDVLADMDAKLVCDGVDPDAPTLAYNMLALIAVRTAQMRGLTQ